MGGNGSGDRLARGAHKAQFPAPGANVSQKKWDSIFGPSKLKSKKKPRKSS